VLVLDCSEDSARVIGHRRERHSDKRIHKQSLLGGGFLLRSPLFWCDYLRTRQAGLHCSHNDRLGERRHATACTRLASGSSCRVLPGRGQRRGPLAGTRLGPGPCPQDQRGGTAGHAERVLLTGEQAQAVARDLLTVFPCTGHSRREGWLGVQHLRTLWSQKGRPPLWNNNSSNRHSTRTGSQVWSPP
jgi:hypothetical protein